MSLVELIEKMKCIQLGILKFLEEESNLEENFENLVNLLTDQKMLENRYEMKSFLQVINAILDHHQRTFNFINKIEQIFICFKKDILKHFSPSQIFNFFKNNKRIILFFIQEEMIIFDEYVISQIIELDYIEYFQPEINKFLTENPQHINTEFHEDIKYKKIENLDEFNTKRKEGVNDDHLCEIIRKNDAKEFGIYISKNCILLDSYIKYSIFESNLSLLNNQEIKLIEYASFYGSDEIIKYMHVNGAELTNKMWKFAIHSRNEEIIKYLEDNKVSLPYNSVQSILIESIQCHHNDITHYIILNLIHEKDLQNNIENELTKILCRNSILYYNYCILSENINCEYTFFFLCENDYNTLVNFYLQHQKIDINSKIIKKTIFRMIFKIKQYYRIKLFIILWNLNLIFNVTALMISSIKGHLEIVRELLSHENIDINIKDI